MGEAITLLAIQELTRFDMWSAGILCGIGMLAIHALAFWANGGK